MPQVQRIYYESKQKAYSRFKEQFKNSAIVDNVTADQMPESFRVKLVDPEQFPIIASAFIGRAGVERGAGPEGPAGAVLQGPQVGRSGSRSAWPC